MIEIEMSKDIRDFEPKIIGPFTTRQLICIGIGAAMGLPFLLVPLPMEVRCILAILLASPGVVCGYLKFYGVYAEKFFLHFLLPIYINPQKRIYKTENSYDYFITPETPPEKNEKKKIRYTKQYRPLN